MDYDDGEVWRNSISKDREGGKKEMENRKGEKGGR
jgi:hypothetical protein